MPCPAVVFKYRKGRRWERHQASSLGLQKATLVVLSLKKRVLKACLSAECTGMGEWFRRGQGAQKMKR